MQKTTITTYLKSQGIGLHREPISLNLRGLEACELREDITYQLKNAMMDFQSEITIIR